MESQNTNDIFKIYGQKPSIPSDLIFYYIFILDQHNITHHQKRRILSTQSQSHMNINPFGSSLQEYLQIQETILSGSRNQKFQKMIILVTDVQCCQQILQDKRKKALIKEVYLCYKQKSFETQSLENKFPIISKEDHDLDRMISKAEEVFQKVRSSTKIFRNFRILSGKKYKKHSFIMKVRANGCIHLSPKQYQKYKELFYTYLKKYLSLIRGEVNKCYMQIIGYIENALTLLNKEKYKEFSEVMLQLYQRQIAFYEVMNKSMMEFTRQDFQWRALALPYHLLYKAIKISFHENKIDIQKLFGQKDYIILWRAGKISDQELNDVKQFEKGKVFIEISSFTSTSLYEQIAVGRFLDAKNWQTNCIMKITLKRPRTKEQIENFSFIYQSFAIVKNKDKRKINEFQILLNSLTVARFLDIKNWTYRKIKKSVKEISDKKEFELGNANLQNKFKHVYSRRTLPVIELQIGCFQDQLENYRHIKSQLDQSVRDVLEHYILTVDFMKNYEEFDIGVSLRLSRDLQAAYEYDTQKIKQLEEQEDKLSNQSQKFKNRMTYHQVCDRCADTCFDLGKQQQSITFSQVSIRTYRMIQEMDTKKSLRQRQEYINKKLNKHAYMLQYFERITEACQTIKQRIREYEKLMKEKKELELACQFFIAKLFVNLGLIWFRQGRVKKAKNYLDESKNQIQKIMRDISYDELKNQQFYFRFVIQYVYPGQGRERLSYQAFVKLKRAVNISKATVIFGGTQKFEGLVNDSQQLKKLIEKRVEEDQRAMASSDEGSEISQIDNLDKMQEQFKDHPLTLNLRPQFQSFFSQFQSSIKNTEKSSFETKFKQILNLVIQAVHQNIQKVAEYNKKIHNLEEQLINQKIDQWQTINYCERGSALQIKKNIERHIIKLREQQFKNSSKLKSKRKEYHQYLKDTISLIHKYIDDQANFGFNCPTLQKMKYRLACQQMLQRQGNQAMAEKELQNIISEASSNKNFTLNLIEAHLISVKLHSSIADLDFINCLQKVSEIKKKEAAIIQTKLIEKCESGLEAALASINQFRKMKEQQKEKQRNHNSSSTLKKIRRQVQIVGEKKQEQNISIMKQKIQKKRIYVTIWKMKCRILKLNFCKQKKTRTQINEIRQMLQLFHVKINSQSLKRQFEGYYNQINGLLFYHQEEQLYSFNSLKQALNSIHQIAEAPRHSSLLTKIFFLFCKQPAYLDEFYNKLAKSELENMVYPFYWRICLANHIHNKNGGRRIFYSIKHCMQFLEERKDIDEYSRMRYSLIYEGEYKYLIESIKNRPKSNISTRRKDLENNSSGITRTNSNVVDVRSRPFFNDSLQRGTQGQIDQKISIEISFLSSVDEKYKQKIVYENKVQTNEVLHHSAVQTKKQLDQKSRETNDPELQKNEKPIIIQNDFVEIKTSQMQNSYENLIKNSKRNHNLKQTTNFPIEELVSYNSQQNQRAQFRQQKPAVSHHRNNAQQEFLFNEPLENSFVQKANYFSSNYSIKNLKMASKKSLGNNICKQESSNDFRREIRTNRYLKASPQRLGDYQFYKRNESYERFKKVLSSCSHEKRSVAQIKEQIKRKKQLKQQEGRIQSMLLDGQKNQTIQSPKKRASKTFRPASSQSYIPEQNRAAYKQKHQGQINPQHFASNLNQI